VYRCSSVSTSFMLASLCVLHVDTSNAPARAPGSSNGYLRVECRSLWSCGVPGYSWLSRQWRVDPGRVREVKNLGWVRAAEAFGVRGSGDGQGGEAVGGLGGCQAVVDVGGAVKANPRMPMLMVVPLHKIGQEPLSIRQGAEAFGEGRGVLQRLKPRLAVGVVIGDLRAGM
jgi:hypothetical protein